MVKCHLAVIMYYQNVVTKLYNTVLLIQLHRCCGHICQVHLLALISPIERMRRGG
jgi:hypothetical protein